jgi:5-methylcytosine-specific restriction protein A
MPAAHLDWTREEIILAMDFYIRAGGLGGSTIPYHDSEEIGSLSGLLNELDAYPPEVRGNKYRNPNGVYLKLMNLRAVQTDDARDACIQLARRSRVARLR